jgi:hypothetical protein
MDMALRAVADHPKLSNLKAILGCGRYQALGALEALWHFTGRFTPQGNIGKYPDSAIEAWVEWDGAPGELISAFTQSGWIDRDSTHRLLVHDWEQHADKATKQSLNRSKLAFCVPTVHTGRIQSSVLSPLPEPEPVPVPVPAPETRSTAAEVAADPFPETTAAAQLFFPEADEIIVEKIALLCFRECPDATDSDIALALRKTHKRNQDGAALWLTTAPAWLKTMKRKAPVSIVGRPRCNICDDTGLVYRQNMEAQPNWYELPEEQLKEPCPECRKRQKGAA